MYPSHVDGHAVRAVGGIAQMQRAAAIDRDGIRAAAKNRRAIGKHQRAAIDGDCVSTRSARVAS